MEGIIIKNISNDYLVATHDKNYTCKARGKFRKDKIKPLVGDKVIFDSTTNYIKEIKPRKNYLIRPNVSNIDQALIVTSVKNPNFDSNLLDKLYPGFFPTDSAKLKALDELTLDDIKEFYSQLLNSATSNFTAVMPTKKYPFLAPTVFEFQNNTQQVTFKKSINKPSQLFKPNATPSVIYDTDTVKQAQIYKSYQFPWSGNVYDEAKFELLNEVLGGSANARLFADLREKQQLAYSVYSDINSFENTGILTLGIKTTTDNKDSGEQSYDNVQKSLEGFKKHTDKLCSELITDEELESAKTTLKQTLIRQFQHPVYSMDLLSMSANEPLGIKRIDKYVEALDSVTKEDIMQAAQFIFAQKPVVSIVASEDTIKSQMNYLKTQGEIHHA